MEGVFSFVYFDLWVISAVIHLLIFFHFYLQGNIGRKYFGVMGHVFRV